MNNVIKFLKKHSSFIVIVLGAISIFLTNIIFKKKLSEADYGEYSLYITFLQMLGSFGLLGYEQVFLRISKVSGVRGIIKTNKGLLIIIFFIWLFVGVFSAYAFSKYYSGIEINFLYFVISALTITFILFVFNVFRLGSNFLSSQLILNSWRITLGFLTIYFIFNKITAINTFIKALSLFFIVIFLLQLFYFINKIKFEFNIKVNSKKINTYAFHFFISLLTISLISFGDKFYIKSNFGLKELGNYFYLATIFLFPFSLIQSYIGFKELVAFKKHTSIISLKKKTIIVLVLGVILGFIILISVYFINKLEIISYINIKDNTLLIITFIITGIIKLIYGLYSALLGAKGDVKTIRNANVQSIITLILLVIIFVNFKNKIEIVALFLAIFWILRTFIWNYNIKKQLNK